MKSEADSSSLVKNTLHELREYWSFSCQSIGNSSAQAVFHKVLALQLRLHARSMGKKSWAVNIITDCVFAN